MKAQPLIAVRDVERSSQWHQQLRAEAPNSPPRRKEGHAAGSRKEFCTEGMGECDEIFSFLEKQSVVAQWSHRNCVGHFG